MCSVVKGDPPDCNNWRGITLLAYCGKVMSRVILNRIRNIVDKRLRQEQAGFREGRSTVDQINTLRVIIEQFAEYQASLYVLFNFERAFDSVDRKKIWRAMERLSLIHI